MLPYTSFGFHRLLAESPTQSLIKQDTFANGNYQRAECAFLIERGDPKIAALGNATPIEAFRKF
jgi:hypothetical protein